MKKTVLFLLVLLLTAGMVTLRYVKTEKQTAAPTGSGLAAQETAVPPPAESPVPSTPAGAPETPAPTEESAPTKPDSPAPVPTVGADTLPKPYTERSYQLVTDLVYVCRELGPETGRDKINALLDELQGEDPALAQLWRGITDELTLVCSDGWTDGTLPNDLPQDDSLCFVVLGFQLLYDGDMAPELLGRCETALNALRQYPNAYVAVTGGGTAFGNRKATEADVMAEWFRQQGIASERIIVENESMTTDQNAVNTCAILTANYPQISRLVVVTSDYHMALGCMMFTEAALLHAWKTGGEAPYSVQAGPSWATSGNAEYSGYHNIMQYVWIMAQKEMEK